MARASGGGGGNNVRPVSWGQKRKRSRHRVQKAANHADKNIIQKKLKWTRTLGKCCVITLQ